MSYAPTEAAQRPSHSRRESLQDRSKLQRLSPGLTKRQVQYTVIVRLPFPRGDFVDPAPVEWDSVKDKALWKIISKESDTRDIDWEEIATRFDVSLPFLMKQAAWLYERHFAGVRKQMQRLATTSTPSAVPSIKAQDNSETKLPPISTAATLLKRTGSKSSQHAASPKTTADSGSATRSTAPAFSRTPSSATITQSRLFTAPRQAARPLRTSGGPVRAPVSPRQRELVLSEDSDDAGESDSEQEQSLAKSQAFRRPPLTSKPTLGGLSSEGDVEEDDDEDESSSAGYLPFAAGVRQDPSATLRGEPARLGQSRGKQKRDIASSASSTDPPPSSESGSRDLLTGPKPGPLSPKHRAQLRQLSPRGSHKDGSDGTPSMGSSFSDLDDAGISASALEDAVLSNIKGGASIASRVSGLSSAFRSQR